jgi:HK97 family phage major capsid protein
METDITADIAGMSKELQAFIAASTKASDELEQAHKETSARLLGIEQKLIARGQGATPPDDGGGETKAPIDPQSGLPVLSAKHKVLDNLPDEVERKGLDLSKFLRGVATGSWAGAAEERKSLDETTNAGGGYLLVPELSAQFIDITRAQTRCIQAGAQTVPMSTSQLRVPVLNTDVTTAWKTELATVATAAPDFGQVLAQARTLAGYVPLVSVELFEDSNLVTQMISNAFARSMAVALDAAALTATGAPAPTGLKSNAAVLQTSVSAGPLTWDEVSLGVAAVRGRNYEPNAFIVGPWGAGELARQKASTAGSYLGPPDDCKDLGRYVTTSAGGSDLFLGDFTRMTFFPRTDVRIEVSRVGDGTAWTKLAVSIRAYLRADVTATEPRAFQVLVGYTS